jgi:hypothetical protein
MKSKIKNKNFFAINPWMTKGLLISRRTKNKLCTASVKNPTPANISHFRNYKKIYSALIKTSKKLYFQRSLAKFQSDAKKTWQILRKAMNKSKQSDNSISKIVVDGKTITDPTVIADRFNHFFVNVAKSITESINTYAGPAIPHSSFIGPKLNFAQNPVTPFEIHEIIQNLKGKISLDQDGLSSFFLKNISMTIATPLCKIISSSLLSGQVPVQLKTAKVIPLFKSDDNDCVDNYRPISLLSVFSKIMEKAVCNVRGCERIRSLSSINV